MDLIGVTKPIWRVLIVGLGLVGLVVGLGWASSRKGGNDMGVMEIELVEEVSMPSIDTSAPTETETATFALG
jgi:hypothetical protein